jgi:hypothetical protein
MTKIVIPGEKVKYRNDYRFRTMLKQVNRAEQLFKGYKDKFGKALPDVTLTNMVAADMEISYHTVHKYLKLRGTVGKKYKNNPAL